MAFVRTKYAGWLYCVLASLMVSIPLYFTRFPPLHDYPFHVAQITILRDVIDGGSLARFYEFNSFAVPNGGADFLVLSLSQIFGVEAACRWSIALTLLLIITGTYFLNTSLHKPDILVILIAALMTYNSVFIMGLLNYLVALSFMLWAIGIFLRIRKLSSVARFTIGLGLGIILFLAHLAAFVLYAIVIAGLELQAAWPILRAAPRAAVTRLMISGLPLVAILGIFYIISPTAGAMGSRIDFGGLSPVRIVFNKYWDFRGIFVGRENDGLDYATTLGAALLIVALLVICRIRVAKEAITALVLLGVAILAAPDNILGSQFLAFRLPIAGAYVLLGFTEITIAKSRVRAAVTACLLVILGMRTAVVAYDWKNFDRVEQEFIDAYHTLPPDSVLFAARGDYGALNRFDPDWRPPIKHIASLATASDRIFVPSTFAEPTYDTIRLRPEFAAVYKFQSPYPITIRDGRSLDELVQQIRQLMVDYFHGNSHPSVYLLLLNPKVLNYPQITDGRLIAHGEMFSLYQLGDDARLEHVEHGSGARYTAPGVMPSKAGSSELGRTQR